MRKKRLLLILVLTVLLVACAVPSTIPPTTVTQNPSGATPNSGMPPMYPYPVAGEPTMVPYPMSGTTPPDNSAYLAPGTPASIEAKIPPSGYEPQAGDNHMRRDPVTLDLAASRLDVTDTQPVQVKVTLNGSLPDSKHVLRVNVSLPEGQNLINIEVYSVVPPGILTSQASMPFTADIPLGSYSSGAYTVVVNGEELGTFIPGYAPQPGDAVLSRGEVTLDMSATQLVTSGSTPNEATVNLSGILPDPCHQLRIVVSPADSQNQINIQVYSVFDPQTMCIMVIKPFEVSIPLSILQNGNYSVYVNGQLLGEFDR